MSDCYTIGQLAATADVPTSTVRYYERIGVLAPAGRTASNYRFYNDAALERLRFIRTAQATGLTLEDITELLDFRDGETAPCAEVEALIAHRLADVEHRMAALRRLQRELTSLKRICETTADKDRCRVVESLATAAAAPALPRRP